ncbi:MspA family porin [Gordonia liuliyuniae]|uniref:MspA family porin n=1 Tax=Gordonia liuliyuniae TaxID=2911517 RepID=A0ABS9INM9_9ACTN|nr:MspA family porin [Gordonia liuliyuniae]MCF8587151.1 MspA family porin [Gordonia liuliyuniae]
MKKSIGVMCAVLVAVISVAAFGVPGDASAGPTRSFADKSVTRHSDDGWTVELSKSGEKIRSVPALSRGHGSYEAFLSLRGAAQMSGSGTVPVDAAVVSTGFQVSCQWQMDGVQLGVTGGPTAQMSISYPPAIVLGAQVMPNISTTLKNGVSIDVPFGQKPLQGPSAGVRLDGVRVEISGCVGARPAVRAYVRVAMTSKANDNTFNLYGTPHLL